MKALILLSLFASFASYAQTLTVEGLKNLMNERKAVLESINPGMSKKVVSTGSFQTETGEECSYTLTSTQTVLKVTADKIIVYSGESFAPAATSACTDAGAIAYDERVLFYDQVPGLSNELAAIDNTSGDVASINQAGDLVTVQLNLKAPQEDGTVISDDVTVQYNLSQSAFKNLVLNQGSGYSFVTSSIADIDVNSIDLTDVLFCDGEESDRKECAPGNYSDILF